LRKKQLIASKVSFYIKDSENSEYTMLNKNFFFFEISSKIFLNCVVKKSGKEEEEVSTSTSTSTSRQYPCLSFYEPKLDENLC
jgi:hypothetical protein